MTFKIETLPAFRLAYLRSQGSYGENNQKVMADLKNWLVETKFPDQDGIIFGIPQDNPQITLPENCRYDACVVIPEDFSLVDQPVSEGRFVPGTYAIFEIDHTIEGVQAAWLKIFSELGEGGYQVAGSPIVERYQREMVAKHRCEICVPLVH